MAQLPPKIPAQWPNGLMLSLLNHNNPSWVDEFLDFSSACRGSHCRSASDSIAFLEAVSPTHPGNENDDDDFVCFDHDQLMSMFSDVDVVDVQPLLTSSTSPSTPNPDHNSNNHEEKAEATGVVTTTEPRAEEAQSECKAEISSQTGAAAAAELVTVDPKRVKRVLANRQSAQRSRVRKLHYISELECSVTTLQTQVSALSPRVAFLDHQRSALTVGNSHLKQRIAALAHDKIFKDAHQEALKKEIERLREVYQQQQSLTNMAAMPTEKELRCANTCA